MSVTLSPASLLAHPAFHGLQEEKFKTPGGFTTSAIGQRLALHFDRTWTPPAGWDHEHEEHNQFPWSWLHEEIYEWIALGEAIRAANDKFTMIELGAGYGRWLVAGAQMARRMRPGLPIKLIGVEAEHAHFQWMKEHFVHNELDPAEHLLVEAAVDAQSGMVQFCEANDPAVDYGQHVHSGVEDPVRVSSRFVNAIGVNELLSQHELIDLIDIDIQGHESIIMPAAIEEMNRRVRRAYVAYHEPASIREELDALFATAGWQNVVSLPCKSDNPTEYGVISFADGCGYWINPRV